MSTEPIPKVPRLPLLPVREALVDAVVMIMPQPSEDDAEVLVDGVGYPRRPASDTARPCSLSCDPADDPPPFYFLFLVELPAVEAEGRDDLRRGAEDVTALQHPGLRRSRPGQAVSASVSRDAVRKHGSLSRSRAASLASVVVPEQREPIFSRR